MTANSLFALTTEEIATLLSLDKSFRAKQVYSWLNRGAVSFSDMTDLPKALREELEASDWKIYSSAVIANQKDETGAVKLGIRLFDGNVVECVLLTDSEGNHTACLSSQAGCAMGCRFCRTATMGFIRNLEACEIVEQFMHLKKAEEGISHIVFMGMGEPLANLKNVVKAIKFFHDPDGINLGMRRITISTCGVISGIRELTELNMPVKLAVSLVSADDELRSSLMPVNKANPLASLKKALIEYQHVAKRRFTFEYCMLSGMNTGEEAAVKLAHFTSGLDIIVNLIPWNAAAELPWKTPSTAEIDSFTAYLDKLKVPYTRRFSRGRGINGACGQLATKLK